MAAPFSVIWDISYNYFQFVSISTWSFSLLLCRKIGIMQPKT